jgi:protein phosphatase PTC7
MLLLLFIGIITNKDLENCSFSITETGGKKGFIDNINRKGLPDGTKLKKHDKEANTSTQVFNQAVRLNLEVGSYALPHPYKKHDGVAANRRGYGAHELSEDMSLCEDAHFTVRLKGDRVDTSQVYMCVADGVGSWRQYGVDPRSFSHKLVQNCKDTIESDNLQRELIGNGDFGGFSLICNEVLHPIDVIMDAWHMTTQEKINGSSTICVATLDNKLNQLSYSNLGDGGLLILRHIDSETSGYMRDRRVHPSSNNNDLKIIYLSQQQLRSFNLPYQLGYSSIEEHPGSFEHPSDADTASIPVIPGDIIILATDGLFDNIDLDDILDETSTWETAWFDSGENSDMIHPQLPSAKGEQALMELSEKLVRKARELSLDKHRDSPFALLAKENDIMW